MRFSSTVLACSVVASVAALPKFANLPTWMSKTLAKGKDTHCDVSKLSLPASSLPPPSSGLKLALIAIGRGTQNYTCPTSTNSSAAPTAIGANALLYDVSCISEVANNDQLADLTAGAEKIPRDCSIFTAIPATAHHFFTNLTTPTFEFYNSLGTVHSHKLNATAAPTSAKNAVPWLKLAANSDSTSPVKEIYRVETANGTAPTTCADNTGAFTVEYAAEYWFYTLDSFSF